MSTSFSLKTCVHVTSAKAIASILKEGLVPQVGPLSQMRDEHPGVFMFPSWDDMMDANWLFDESWPYDSEPALLAVDTSGLALDMEAGFEVICPHNIPADRVTVIAPTEFEWDKAEALFYQLGGRKTSLTSEEVLTSMPEYRRLP